MTSFTTIHNARRYDSCLYICMYVSTFKYYFNCTRPCSSETIQKEHKTVVIIIHNNIKKYKFILTESVEIFL